MENVQRYRKYEPFFDSWYFEDRPQEIGSGSFGSVFRIVRHDSNVPPCALKIIPIPGKEAEITTLRFQGMSDEDIRRHYQQKMEEIKKEYELMSELKGCDNIVSCEDFKAFQRKDGLGYDIMIRMELLLPLTNYRLKANKDIDEGGIVKLGIDICKALEICQKDRIIHRDIKPENIFISKQGNFKLGDFGIARTMEQSNMQMTIAGTKNYMAPEVFKEQPYDKTADIYSLGIVLYQMLNDNRLPFLTPDTMRSADARETAFHRQLSGDTLEKPAHGSDELAEVILKACRYEKSERYQEPKDMRKSLEKFPVSEIDMAGIDIFEPKKGWEDADRTEILFKDRKQTVNRDSDAPTDLLKEIDSDKTELLKDRETPAGKFSKNKKLPLILGASVVGLAVIAGTAVIAKQNQQQEISVESTERDQMNQGTEGSKENETVSEEKFASSGAVSTEEKNMLSEEEQILEERKKTTQLKGKSLEKFSDLADYENLEKLDLSEMEIKDISVVENLKKLKELNISYTNVEDISVLKKCKELISLNLSYNNENMTGKKIMETLSAMAQLQELDLSGDMVAGNYEDKLEANTSLEVLRVGATGISKGNFLKKLKKLKILDIHSNLMLEDLNNIVQLEKLEELNISVTGITNLKGIEKMKMLKVLDISMTDISDISMLKSLKKLESVTVSESPKMKQQIKTLKKTLKDCKFKMV